MGTVITPRLRPRRFIAMRLPRTRRPGMGIAGFLATTTRLVRATIGTPAIGHTRLTGAPPGLVRVTTAAAIIAAIGADSQRCNPLANCLGSCLPRKAERAEPGK
jgi:hypothetical protein